MICKRCEGQMVKNGTFLKKGERKQKYKCSKCGYETKNAEEIIVVKEPEQKIAGITEEQFRAKFDLNFIVGKKCGEFNRINFSL